MRRFLTFCEATGSPPVLDRATVAAFVVDLLEQGAEASTARSRQLAVKRFSRWLADEDEIDRDQLVGIAPPKLDTKVYQPLTDDQVRAMIAACTGLDQFRDRRDEALIRFMVETGCRAGEVAVMQLSDVNPPAGVAIVRRGKGGKGRSVPFGAQTTHAIDRYIRARRTHRLASTDALWLGARGKEFSYDSLHQSLRMRAQMAGVSGFTRTCFAIPLLIVGWPPVEVRAA